MNAFEVLVALSSAWAGKQIYFQEEDGFVYSRETGKTMSIPDAVQEFADKLSDW